MKCKIHPDQELVLLFTTAVCDICSPPKNMAPVTAKKWEKIDKLEALVNALNSAGIYVPAPVNTGWGSPGGLYGSAKPSKAAPPLGTVWMILPSPTLGGTHTVWDSHNSTDVFLPGSTPGTGNPFAVVPKGATGVFEVVTALYVNCWTFKGLVP